MARRDDSGWRDAELNLWHERNGFPCPAAGMVLPMIEYDRGRAVGLVNYMPRGKARPQGPDVSAAYRAFGRLHHDTGGAPLPFLTVEYDPRNWAMRVFPHNDAARRLVGREGLTSDWDVVTEAGFAGLLYGMRERTLPDLFTYGIEFATGPWMSSDRIHTEADDQPFPCADMSARRRVYEPTVTAPMRVKVPCLDVDLAVIDWTSETLSVVVDYKRRGAVCDTEGTNAKALASLAHPTGPPVAAFMTRYWGDRDGYWFETYPLNRSAAALLKYVLGWELPGWTSLSEDQWLSVLRCARDV